MVNAVAMIGVATGTVTGTGTSTFDRCADEDNDESGDIALAFKLDESGGGGELVVAKVSSDDRLLMPTTEEIGVTVRPRSGGVLVLITDVWVVFLMW